MASAQLQSAKFLQHCGPQGEETTELRLYPFKFSEKLLCCVRIAEQFLRLGVHLTAGPVLTLAYDGHKEISAEYQFGNGIIGADWLIRTSGRGGILLLLWHRLGFNNPLWSFALRGGS